MVFEIIETESKKNLYEILTAISPEEEDLFMKPYLTCPFPDKNYGKDMVQKECGIIRLTSGIEYCNPRKIEECKLIYGERGRK